MRKKNRARALEETDREKKRKGREKESPARWAAEMDEEEETGEKLMTRALRGSARLGREESPPRAAVAADRETNAGKEGHTPRKIESPENKVKEIKPE